MKKIFLTLILAIMQFYVVYASDKIAVVNISNIFQQSTHRENVIKRLENEFKDRATELQLMERDLQTKINTLQREGSTMNENERNILEESLISQREDFSNKAKAFQQDNHHRQTEERDKILNIIHNVVENIAKKKGYDIVIDTSAIAYVNNSKDITADILKWMQ